MLTVPQEIKDLLHQDTCRKNIRIQFPNGERTDICNGLIVKDSVQFTESLCSQDTLKFGLCESPVFECETVGVGNIKGATITVLCEIYCDMSVSGAVFRPDLEAYVYPIPYGTFVVDSCKRQADMIHRKILAFTRLIYSPWQKDKNTLSYAQCACPVTTSSDYDTSIEKLVYEGCPSAFNRENYTWTESSFDFYPYTHNETWSAYDAQHNLINYGMTYRYALPKATPLPAKKASYVDCSKIVLNDIDEDAINDFLAACDSAHAGSHATNLKNLLLNSARTNRVYVSRQNIDMRCEILDPNIIYCMSTADETVVATGATYVQAILVNHTTSETIASIYISFHNSSCYKIYSTVEDVRHTPVSLPKQSCVGSIVGVNFYNALDAYEALDVQRMFSDSLELRGVFGRFGRYGIDEINIKQLFNLTPESTLYPSSSLYPEGVTGGKLLPSDYQSCWYDDDYTKPYGTVTCEFKDSNNDDYIYIYYLTGFDEDTDITTYKTYDIRDNYFINLTTWTEAQIKTICETIAANIEGVTYMPVEFTGRGLPYVEAGDTFEILTKSNDSITTIVLNRTLSGEQTLTDSYKSV